MSTTPSNRVLLFEYVTGGGFAGQDVPPTWEAEGRAMRLALCEEFSSISGTRVVVMLDQRFSREAGPWATERVGPGEAEHVLAALSKVARHTLVVAPETGGLLARCASLADRGWLGSTREAIEVCADKARLADHLRGRGVRVPDHWIVHPGDRWPVGAPDQAVLKPIDGAGSLDTRLVNRSEGLSGFRDAMLLQTYQPGTAMSASFLVDDLGRPLLMGVGVQRVRIRESSISYEGGCVPRGDLSWAEEARRAVECVSGLRGWIGVDFVREETGRCTVLEINPRVTTSLVGLRACLPSGTIARAWMASAIGDGEDLAGRIAEQVHAHPPICFDADGRVDPVEEGARG